MRRKFSFRALAVLMAILTAVVTPLQAIAASQKEYIQEIRIGYGEEGKKALTDAGYTVWEDLDANEGGTGSAVYLGYKTTTVKEDAITDVAIMPMQVNGESPFSFDRYAEEMENINKQVDQQIEDFDEAIKEFRTNLQKAAPQNEFAEIALKLLNQYKEDDSGELVGNLFAMDRLNEEDTDGSALKDTYHKILMTGNSTAVVAVQTALAMGVTETSGETFLDRLEKGTYTGEVDPAYNEAVSNLATAFSTFREEVLAAKSVYDAAYAYDADPSVYVETLDSQDRSSALQQIALVTILESIDYADLTLNGKQYSFLDVVLLPTDLTEGEVCLTSAILEPLAKAMTPGQLGIVLYSSLDVLVSNAYTASLGTEDGHYDLSATDTYMEALQQYDVLSVYTGVDRSIFEDGDYHTVAITDAAMRNETLTSSFGVLPEYNSSSVDYKLMGVSGLVTSAVGMATLFCACTKINGVVNFTTFQEIVQEKVYILVDKTSGNEIARGVLGDLEALKNKNNIMTPTKLTEQVTIDRLGPVTYSTSLGTKVALVAGAIALAAGIALAVYGFIMNIKTSQPAKVEYDPIPRALIDVKREDSGINKFFVYYAARLAGASDDYKNEEDTTKLYGDLNGLNQYEDWLCLYYAKDLRLGSPLTPDILVKDSAKLTLTQKKNYLPVHSFMDNSYEANSQDYAPSDLNQTSQKENHPTIYLFLKRDTSVAPLTSTIVDETTSFNWVAIVTFFVGAGLTAGAAVFVMKRKNRKKGIAKA